mgnify:CR=1 FL=1
MSDSNLKLVFSKLVMNRSVVETYIPSSKSNINNDIKLNTNEQAIEENNLKNSGNIIENIDNKDNNKSSNNQKEIKGNNIKKIFSECSELNLNLISHKKTFDMPLLITQNSLNYLREKQIKDNIDKNDINELIKNKNSSFNKNLEIKASNLFIVAQYNSQGHRINLSNDLSNNVNDKVVLKENNNFNEKKENEDDLLNSISIISKRWKEFEKKSKFNISYINTNEVFILNRKKYVDKLIDKIDLNSNADKNYNQQYYLLIKQDLKSKNNSLIHEIILPMSNKDLEESINKFVQKSNEDKENNNNSNYGNISYNIKNDEIHNPKNKKKMSKFSNQHLFQKNSEEMNQKKLNDKQLYKEDFSPILILTQTQIKSLSEIISNKTNDKIEDEKKKEKSSNINNQKESTISTNEILSKKREDINLDIIPSKICQFEFIHSNDISSNVSKINNSIEVSNIPLNQKDYSLMNQIKEEIIDDNLSFKSKEKKDFGQCTPIALLQEKYFVYAVSKWAKYSDVIPQSKLFIKYNYKSGHPKFDPIHLDMTNFCLWIEKIRMKKYTRKSPIPTNYGNNNFKTNSNSKLNGSKYRNYINNISPSYNGAHNYNEGMNPFSGKKPKTKPKIGQIK